MKTQSESPPKRKPSNQQGWIAFFVNALILGIMFVFSLWWQDAYTLKAMADGIWLVVAIQLTLSWSLFVYNKNIFTPLVHGIKTFFLIFIGKKPKEDYYTAYTKVIDNQIPSKFIWVSFFLTLLVILVGIVLVLLAY